MTDHRRLVVELDLLRQYSGGDNWHSYGTAIYSGY